MSPPQSLASLFGERIKALRLERDLTQAQLARLARCGQNSISNIEHGRRQASCEVIERLAEALLVDERDLYTFPGKSELDDLCEAARLAPLDAVKTARRFLLERGARATRMRKRREGPQERNDRTVQSRAG